MLAEQFEIENCGFDEEGDRMKLAVSMEDKGRVWEETVEHLICGCNDEWVSSAS